MNLYSVYDTAAELYNLPFAQKNDAVATRTAHQIMADADSTIRQHPEQFIMFKIGTFDDQTGQIKPADKFVSVVRFHEITIKQADVYLADFEAISNE